MGYRTAFIEETVKNYDMCLDLFKVPEILVVKNFVFPLTELLPTSMKVLSRVRQYRNLTNVMSACASEMQCFLTHSISQCSRPS